MLTHPTLDLLHELGLHGMANGFKMLEQNAEARTLEHAEWLGLLLQHEQTLRRQKRFETRAKNARLPSGAFKKSLCKRPDNSSAICDRFIILPEPFGHSILNSSPW